MPAKITGIVETAEPAPSFAASRWTPAEYLEFERDSEDRHEYEDGVLVAMAGAKWNHSVICGNIEFLLHTQFDNTDCQFVSRDQRVRIPKCNRYYYPDGVIVCGEPEFEDNELDTLLNPLVVFEVLSPTTEPRDLGSKMRCYQTLPTLQAYVLVAHDRPQIACWTPTDAGNWNAATLTDLSDGLEFQVANCRLPLSDIYARIAFV